MHFQASSENQLFLKEEPAKNFWKYWRDLKYYVILIKMTSNVKQIESSRINDARKRKTEAVLKDKVAAFKKVKIDKR